MTRDEIENKIQGVCRVPVGLNASQALTAEERMVADVMRVVDASAHALQTMREDRDAWIARHTGVVADLRMLTQARTPATPSNALAAECERHAATRLELLALQEVFDKVDAERSTAWSRFHNERTEHERTTQERDALERRVRELEP